MEESLSALLRLKTHQSNCIPQLWFHIGAKITPATPNPAPPHQLHSWHDCAAKSRWGNWAGWRISCFSQASWLKSGPPYIISKKCPGNHGWTKVKKKSFPSVLLYVKKGQFTLGCILFLTHLCLKYTNALQHSAPDELKGNAQKQLHTLTHHRLSTLLHNQIISSEDKHAASWLQVWNGATTHSDHTFTS